MTFFIRISAFMAFTIGAYGQSPPPIKGVKILLSTFDSRTRIVKVVFINDSHAEISAYGVFIQKHYQNSQGTAWTGSTTWGRDFVRPSAYYKVETKKRSTLPALSNQPIHPGQTAEESSDLSGEQDLVSVDMRIDMVAYSDGTAEVENEVTFQRLLISRQADLLAAQKAAEIGTSVLSNKYDPHPIATLIAKLRQVRAVVPEASWQGPEGEGFAKSWLESLDILIGELQKPGSGTYMDTITQAQQASSQSDSSERDFVGNFVEVQKRYANIFAKHAEIRRVNQ
jgi:hypothetical protein